MYGRIIPMAANAFMIELLNAKDELIGTLDCHFNSESLTSSSLQLLSREEHFKAFKVVDGNIIGDSQKPFETYSITISIAKEKK